MKKYNNIIMIAAIFYDVIMNKLTNWIILYKRHKFSPIKKKKQISNFIFQKNPI